MAPATAFVALAMLAAALVVPPVSAAAATDGVENLQRQVAQLRTDADQASAELAARTEQYAASRQRLRDTERRLLATADAEQHAAERVERARVRLVAFAVAAFESPVGDDLGALLDNPLHDVDRARSTADVSYLSQQQAAAVRGYEAGLARQRALHAHAQALVEQARTQRTGLADQLRRLRSDAEHFTHRLLAELDRLTVRLAEAGRYGAALRVSRERMRRTGEAVVTCDKPAVRGFPNGLIPVSLLCPLPERGHYLRADAARAFWLLDALYRARFGTHICVTDSYRSLAAQYSVYRRKPALAAIPGTSRHGLGVAVDLGCGIQTYGSTRFRWMKAHAPRFGWVHPYWAEHSPFEPWHWEYSPG